MRTPSIVRIKEIILTLSHTHHMNTAILMAPGSEGDPSEHLVGGIRVTTSVREVVWSTNG
jgi:hypothetical protein